MTFVVLAPWLLHLGVGPLSSLHVSDRRRRRWWWPGLAVKTTVGDGMLMLQAAGTSVVLYVSVCVIKCTVALIFFSSFWLTWTSINTDLLQQSPEVRVNKVLL